MPRRVAKFRQSRAGSQFRTLSTEAGTPVIGGTRGFDSCPSRPRPLAYFTDPFTNLVVILQMPRSPTGAHGAGIIWLDCPPYIPPGQQSG